MKTNGKKNAARAKSWNDMPAGEFADEMLKQVATAKPMLTASEMDGIEQTWETHRRGRRCQLAIFTKPGKFIVEKIEKDREFAVMVAEVLAYTEGSMKFYKGLLELMTAVSTRTSVALCYRTDMDKVVTEGKQRYLADQVG